MTGERLHDVRIGPLPAWLDRERLLGPGPWTWDADTGTASARLPRSAAADVQARLRGQGLAGLPIEVDVRPRLSRPVVRQARLVDARRRRHTSPGFSRSEAWLDDEGRRSLTPEALANALATRAAAILGKDATVLDACCGAGGNAIAFARAGLRVVANEIDPERLRLARHNAQVYGVADRITFQQGDATQAVARIHADLLWIDPPWGEAWTRTGCGLMDLPLLAQVLDAAADRFAHTWCKVPPSFDPATTPGFEASAWFGVAAGDAQRIKLVLLTR